MYSCVPFCKVVVLKIDILDSIIVDERYFDNYGEAIEYAKTMECSGYIPVVVQMELSKYAKMVYKDKCLSEQALHHAKESGIY